MKLPRRRQRKTWAERRFEQSNPKWELFKFQWPLDGDTSAVLVYPQSQQPMIYLDKNLEGLRELFEGHIKMYAWGRWFPKTNKFEFDRSRPFIFNPAEYPKW